MLLHLFCLGSSPSSSHPLQASSPSSLTLSPHPFYLPCVSEVVLRHSEWGLVLGSYPLLLFLWLFSICKKSAQSNEELKSQLYQGFLVMSLNWKLLGNSYLHLKLTAMGGSKWGWWASFILRRLCWGGHSMGTGSLKPPERQI